MTAGGCPICGGSQRERMRWQEPPERETRFELPEGVAYERVLLLCERCGHLSLSTPLKPELIYGGTYVDSTYADGIEAAYERIMALPAGASDNLERVERVCSHLAERLAKRGDREPPTVLDVGSGLGVFGARMKERGWSVTALDPDPRAVAHSRERVGVKAVKADFIAVDRFGSFDLVTLNKVLEHVQDPRAMLARAGLHLAESGTVYVEVPDGEVAVEHGPDREELFIEHLHAFSAASLALLASGAGYLVDRIDRLYEPSDKFTLAAFLRPRPS